MIVLIIVKRKRDYRDRIPVPVVEQVDQHRIQQETPDGFRGTSDFVLSKSYFKDFKNIFFHILNNCWINLTAILCKDCYYVESLDGVWKHLTSPMNCVLVYDISLSLKHAT